MTNLEPTKQNQYVLVANDMKIKIVGMTEFNIFSTKIRNVVYIDNILTNLLSIKNITQELEYDVIFSQNDIKF
jgi:hypothetical protein